MRTRTPLTALLTAALAAAAPPLAAAGPARPAAVVST